MENLIKILKEQTTSLKMQYVQAIRKWTTEHYERCLVRKQWSEVDWCKHFGIEPEPRTSGLGFPKGFYNTVNAKFYDSMCKDIKNVLSVPLEDSLEKAEKAAIEHYENSILKLAHRISEKGLIEENIEVKTSHVGVNIETILTDGIKTVRAFTVLAQGEVQRPHYRYLIK